MNATTAKLNEAGFHVVICLVAAHVITRYNTTTSFFEVAFTAPYIRGMVASFVIALILTQYIHYISQRLDKKYDWYSQSAWRLIWQSMLGYALPAIFAFILASIFFSIYDINILKTTYLQQDYPLILMMLFAFNLLIISMSLFKRSFSTIKELEAAKLDGRLEQSDVITSINYRQVLTVQTTFKTIPIKVEDIAYLFILQGNVFVRTKDSTTINDSQQVSVTLKTLEETLDPKQFFRINRQTIVNFNACHSYSSFNTKLLQVTLNPIPYKPGMKVPDEHQRLSVVSEDRVSAFKQWINR